MTRTMHRPPDDEVVETPMEDAAGLAGPSGRSARNRRLGFVAALVVAVVVLAAGAVALVDRGDSTDVRQGGTAAPAASSDEPAPTPTTTAAAPAAESTEPAPSQPAPSTAGPSCPAAAPAPPTPRTRMALAGAPSGLVVIGGVDGKGGSYADTYGYACGAWRAPVAAGSPKPPGGANGVAAFDAARGAVVLVAGDQSTWTLKDGTWSPRPGAAKPPKMAEPRMTYDSVRQRVLLLGVPNRANAAPELWVWDGSTWTASPAAVPTNRLEAAFAFDEARGKAVLFGGQGSFDPSTKSNETWTFDGVAWTKESPAQSPPAGRAHAAYDPVRREVVALTQDGTWAWDGKTWAKRTDAGAGPGFRGGTNLVWDPALQRVVVFGGKTFESVAGDLWAFDGKAWSKLA